MLFTVFKTAYLAGILSWIIYTDFKKKIIPDMAHVLLIIFALTAGYPDIKQSIAGMITGFTLMLAVSFLGPTGGGDIKLMGSLGAWFGLQIIDVFLVSYIFGSIIAAGFYLKYRNKRQEIPFGPAIALSAFVIYCTDYPVLYPYLSHFLRLK